MGFLRSDLPLDFFFVLIDDPCGKKEKLRKTDQVKPGIISFSFNCHVRQLNVITLSGVIENQLIIGWDC